MNYSVVIPAFDPDAGILQIVEAVAATRPEAVVVIDDGSPADKADRFRGLKGLERVVVLRHERNRGKGMAIKTGLRYVLKHNPNAVGAVTMDADGQHTLEDMLKVGSALVREKHSLVMGVRRFGREVPLRSRVGNVVTKTVFNFATGMSLIDTQTGLRAIPMSLVPPLLQVASSRYEFDLDMLFLALRMDIPLRSVDIQTVYIDRNRSSHFRPVKDSMRIYRRLAEHVVSLLWERVRPARK